MIKSSSWAGMAGILALMLLFSMQAPLAAADHPAGITLIMTKQAPYPVEPGDIVNVEVSLHNNGSSSERITIEVVPDSPFTLLPGQEQTKTYSKIDPFDSVTQTYRLKVDESAISDIYDLEFRYYSGLTAIAYVVKQMPVTVQGTPNIIIKDVRTSPASVEPGDEVEITVTLSNEGTGNALQTELSLIAEADAETGESLIVPVLAGGIYYLGDFAPGEEADAVFKLEVDIAAEYKTYISTLTVNYDDDNGVAQTASFTMGIPVKGEPIIEVLSAKIDNGAFKVDIENIGTGNAKALRIAFVQDGDIKDSSVANELKPTKHKTIRFQGFREGAATINISYLNEANEFFMNEIPVTVKRSASASETGGADYSSLVIVLMLVVVLESYYVWRIRKRLKKK